MSGIKKNIFLAMLLMLLFVVSCSNNEIKPIEDAKEINFTIIDNGIVVNSVDLREEEEIKKVIDFYNNATFISKVKEDILVKTVPMEEELSNSNILIHINPDENVYIVYKRNSIFKVIDENKKVAFNIKSPELLEFIIENDKNRSVIFHEFNTNIIFNLEDLDPYFSTPELLLVPQGADDYPKLNGVEAKAYELIDGGVYIHVFSNNEELKKGASQVKDVYDIYGNWGAIVYEVNNMLFIYFPSIEELKKENDIKMKNAIKKMVENRE